MPCNYLTRIKETHILACAECSQMLALQPELALEAGVPVDSCRLSCMQSVLRTCNGMTSEGCPLCTHPLYSHSEVPHLT